MATPPDSPIEEVVYELETTSRTFPKPIPVALEDLCRLTKFTRQEIRVMYRGFKVSLYLKILDVPMGGGKGMFRRLKKFEVMFGTFFEGKQVCLTV